MAGLKDYAQELFKKANLEGNDKAKALLEALGDDDIQKAFRNGFVETPAHHSTLDRLKGEWEPKVTAAEAKVKQYDEWYSGQAKPAYDQIANERAILQRYQQTYGPIDSVADVRQAAAQTGMTMDEVKQLMAQTVEQQNRAYVGLTKDVAWATMDYQSRFKGDLLDLDAVEAHALKTGVPFRQAYKDVIAPKMEELRNTEFEAKLKSAREEGARDALSKHKLPVESGPREPHPIFDRKAPEAGVDELGQERNSRNAFVDGWNSFNESKAS